MEVREMPYKGNILMTWEVEEFETHERGLLWYFISAIVGIAFLIYALATQNFLFAVIVIMFGIIIGLSSLREPQRMSFVMTDVGIGIGQQFFPFKELKEFWILYEPPEVKNIYFEFKRAIRPHLVVPLYDVSPLDVRETLLDFVDENPEDHDEPLTDLFGRLLKL